jgi:hypothetical protein
MYAFKGFSSHADFIKNTPGQIATVGEISDLSRSFSREVGEYSDAAQFPRITIISMLSKKDDTLVEAQESYRTQALKITKFIYDNTINHGGQVFADELLQKLITTYDAEAEDFRCGAIVQDGNIWMPEWVSWKSKIVFKDDGTTRDDNLFKFWFVDSNFQTHYDEYEILVVPPFDDVDYFFRTGQEVKLALESITVPEVITKAQLAKNGVPETVIRIDSFDYHDQQNAQNVVPSLWCVLIYGNAGNNIDSIKDALVNWVLAHSTHTRDEWVKILPDLFRRTEFILVPRWDLYSIEDRASQTGVHDPQAPLSESLQVLKTYATNVSDQAHINEHGYAMGFPYKSMHILTVGGTENKDNKFELRDYYPDLINVSSTSPDFARMSQPTQNFALKLMQMVLDAEWMGIYDSPTTGYSKVIRNNLLFVVLSVDNIQYLVAAKSNFTS